MHTSQSKPFNSGYTFGSSEVTLASSKLRLFVRPYDDGVTTTTRERALAATIGPATKKALPPDVQQFTLPVRLTGTPSPGIYNLWARTLDGFATTPDGSEMPLRVPPNQTDSRDTRLVTISWPDESVNDRELSRWRSKLVGHLVYGYGGLSISCGPAWEKQYSSSTPIRIHSVEREGGRMTWRFTGRDASAPYALGLGFIAFDPLRIVVDAPAQAPLGENYRVGGSSGVCPAIELADWQVDTTLSLDPPPVPFGATPPPVSVGMSRDDVVWTRGYPNEIGARAALRAQPTWQYGHTSTDQYAITFRDDRVVSFTTPGL